MSRINGIFSSLRASGRKGIMPFICGSHPSPGDTAALLPALQDAGASIVEIGLPFSDPIADGPVIAAAMHDALTRGASPPGVLDEVCAVRDRLSIGLVAMVSVSIVHRMGPKLFVENARLAGFDGFIFPDCPVEESGDLLAHVRDAGLTASLLVAPTTSTVRVERIVKACSGFVYMLARVGITGEGREVPEVAPRVQQLRRMTDLPLAVGFGISSPEHVRAVVQEGGADAAIVGSALVRRLSEARVSGRDIKQEASVFVRSLTSGLRP